MVVVVAYYVGQSVRSRGMSRIRSSPMQLFIDLFDRLKLAIQKRTLVTFFFPFTL